MVLPPAFLNSSASAAISSGSENSRLSFITMGSRRSAPRRRMLTGSSSMADCTAPAGGRQAHRKSMKRCSWVRVTPSASLGTGPLTVITAMVSPI